MRILIDTCVILDLLIERKGANEAENVLNSCATNKNIGYVTAKSCCDLYYVLRKEYHSKEIAIDKMKKILLILDILDTSATDINNAFDNEVKDYEDAVMVETALRNNIEAIITNNIKDYKQQDKVKIIEPKEISIHKGKE